MKGTINYCQNMVQLMAETLRLGHCHDEMVGHMVT